MNREDVIAVVSRLELGKGTFLLIGGTVLAMHGIRQCNDVDILLDARGVEEMKKKQWRSKKNSRTATVFYDKLVECYSDLNIADNYNPSFGELYKRMEVVNEIPTMSLQDLMAFKKIYGRQKDLDDVALIEASLRGTTLGVS